MVVDSLIEAAAIAGVAAMWAYSTLKIVRLWAYFAYGTFKICEKIVSPPSKPLYQCEYCAHEFTSDFLTRREGMNCCIYVCKRCEDDEELEARYGDERRHDFCKLKK